MSGAKITNETQPLYDGQSTELEFNTVVYDTYDYKQGNTLTVPEDGMYLAGCRLSIKDLYDVGSTGQLYLKKGQEILDNDYKSLSNAEWLTFSVTAPVIMEAGESLTIGFIHNTGRIINSDIATFWITKL